MTANSYLEYALTVLGWLVSNGIWNAIATTGMFSLPLLMKLIAHYLKAREQGVDEGDAGGLTLHWMESTVYVSMMVIMFTCEPLFNVDITEMTLDKTRSMQCDVSVPAVPENNGYAPLVNSLSGQIASVPVWWYLVHTLSKGLTESAIAAIPCEPDLRQLRFEVQHTRINNPLLAQELKDFTLECYAPSLVHLKQQDVGLSYDDDQDVAWIGSSRFLTRPGYYDSNHARSPRKNWSYNSDRDAGLVNTGRGGYPTCRQWWSDSNVGLKPRLLAMVKPDIWQTFRKLAVSQSSYEEAVLRSLVSPRNMEVSQDGRTYSGYGGTIAGSFTNALTRTIATTGQVMATTGAFPAFDSLRQALPMVQAILQMALIICIPLVTVFSAYSIKTVLTLTFAQFGLIFLTFWWELARWLDGWMMSLLYSGDTHSYWNLAGLQNTQDDLIMQFVTGTMFIVLPAFWMGALGWAGLQLGGTIERAAISGVRDAFRSGGNAGERIRLSSGGAGNKGK
ncbi:MAG: conjugal transfer protein TraG N-terminal domain-containing protein [Scandinavium sp.]|uniref:conjugal transfer protein TraG N-terminal domain-containing protein n=1 Tax=Scandinavium sp. TaxID=2830653 RepID=UPI003F2BF22B